jgi:DNA-binding MarR family transcriptional regulator
VASNQELIALWHNLHHAHDAVRTALRERLDQAGGCSLLEHDLMSWLEVEDGNRPRMQELAKLLGMTPGGTTRLVDRLVQRGWVRRLQAPGNRREVYTQLTADGKQALRPARVAYFQALRDTLDTNLPDTDIGTLTTLTGTLLRTTDQALAGNRGHTRRPSGGAS